MTMTLPGPPMGLAAEDPNRPLVHVAPRQGWLNDPNGLIYYRGRYHLFYQHVPQGCEWQWGLVWGHAVSDDLAHWQHLPPALEPTLGGPDADGCWSGCCVVSAEGVPTLLYTVVRLRSNPSCGPLPPPDQDLGLLWIETQCAAVPEDPDDDLLLRWRKTEQPALALPPPGMHLTGWRDPFVYLGAREAAADGNGSHAAVEQMEPAQRAQPGSQEARKQGYRMLLGSGIKGSGGALLAYSRDLHSGENGGGDSSTLASGWQLEGLLFSAADLAKPAAAAALAAAATDEAAAPSTVTALAGDGEKAEEKAQELSAAFEFADVWECPLLTPLPAGTATSAANSAPPPPTSDVISSSGSSPADQPWLLAVSPYPVKPPYAGRQPANPVLYWIGQLDDSATRFDLQRASGPFRLDHGDVLYAPNVCTDAQCRLLLWAWLQERRPPGAAATYSGCLTAPRLLSLSPDGRRLVQRPAPSLALLRRCLAAGRGGMSHALNPSSKHGMDCSLPATSPSQTSEAGRPYILDTAVASRRGWYADGVEVPEGQLLPIDGVEGLQLDIELVFRRGSASSAGLLILSHEAGSQGNALLTYSWHNNSLEVCFGVPAPQPAAAAAAADMADGIAACSRVDGRAGEEERGDVCLTNPAVCSNRWQLPVHEAGGSPQKALSASVTGATAAAAGVGAGSTPGSPAVAAVALAAETAPDMLLAALAEPLPEAAAVQEAVAQGVAEAAVSLARRVGGRLAAAAADSDGRVQLRVLLDGSALEVFTGSGEVLSTRVYRGHPPPRSPSVMHQHPGCSSGVFLAALGGTALLDSGEAWELDSCWVGE